MKINLIRNSIFEIRNSDKNFIARITNYVLLITLLVLCLAQTPARAEKKDEVMTKGQAIMLLSATDFMKQKIGELVSWTVGYDVSKVNRVKLTPTINYIKAVPRQVPPDGRTVLDLLASVDDPGGLANIAGVRADLSSIGRLPNTMLVDNGVYGDKQAGGGVYTLQTSVSPRIALGDKDITVAVANKKGWLALAKTSLEVRKNPVVTEVKLRPERALAGSGTSITITVAVDNPGRLEDIDGVIADLSALRLAERAQLLNNGQPGNVWSLQFTLGNDVVPGTYLIPVKATNLIGGLGAGQGTLTVYK